MKNRPATSRRKPLVMEHLVPVQKLDRSFDIIFWQTQDSTSRFAAAWDLALFATGRKRMPVNTDFKELLKIFNREKVRYLIVGGYAVILRFDRKRQKKP